jgi:ribosome recycling factor
LAFALTKEQNMTIADIKKNTEAKMDQSILAFKNNLAKIRTGRANPALLDTIHVEYYGSMVPLSQVANVSLLEMTKLARNEAEGAKVAVRNLRRDANDAVKKLVKDKLASEDDQKRAEADVQKSTDKRIAEIDALVAAKEQEIMAI